MKSSPEKQISSARAIELAELADRLSPRARETYDKIARLVAEGEDEAAIAAQLGLGDPAEVRRAMEELTEELEGLRVGATLPALAESERDALRDSLSELGQLVPVLVDEHGTALDGTNRLELLAELGIEPELKVVTIGGDEVLRRRVQLAANTVRRMLSATARQRTIRQELVHDPARSDRSIAGLLGVANHTVAKVRRELEESGSLLRLDQRVGSDGVPQRVAKKRTTSPRPPKVKQARPFEYVLEIDRSKSYGGAVVFSSGRVSVTIGEPEWRKLDQAEQLSVRVGAVP